MVSQQFVIGAESEVERGLLWPLSGAVKSCLMQEYVLVKLFVYVEKEIDIGMMSVVVGIVVAIVAGEEDATYCTLDVVDRVDGPNDATKECGGAKCMVAAKTAANNHLNIFFFYSCTDLILYLPR